MNRWLLLLRWGSEVSAGTSRAAALLDFPISTAMLLVRVTFVGPDGEAVEGVEAGPFQPVLEAGNPVALESTSRGIMEEGKGRRS